MRNILKGIVIFAVLAIIPAFTNNYHQYVVNLIFVNFLVSLGAGGAVGVLRSVRLREARGSWASGRTRWGFAWST